VSVEPGARLAGDLRAAFNSSNPKPLEYLELASSCLERARMAVDQGLPLDAKAWLETARAGLETAYRLQELVEGPR
jgi:hypothetical protein